MSMSFNLFLVILSYLVAVVSAYVTFDIIYRLTGKEGNNRLLLLTSGSFALGIGIWSMHFIGVLALHLPDPHSYNKALVFLSMVVAIISTFISLSFVSKSSKLSHTFLGSIILGIGLSNMHYIGTAALEFDGTFEFNTNLVVLSVLIGIIDSFVAFSIGL
jgi:NO-binding membrane sensor protein with MHYT domain